VLNNAIERRERKVEGEREKNIKKFEHCATVDSKK
jgi:hypothetical protein